MGPGCGVQMTQLVPTKYSYKEVPAVCGQTSYYGDPVLCIECEKKNAGRDWRREAEEAGETWDEEGY